MKPDHTQPSRSSASTLGRDLITLALFVGLVLGGGVAIGMATAPGPWFAALIKPPFNPPNWLFGPVWTVLYLAIAFVGWRCWRRHRDGIAMKFWFFQMVLNFSWSPVFFSAHRIDLALGIILMLFVLILGFVATTWNRDRISALLFVPYAAWVGFASVLNGSILWLNSGIGGA